MSENNTSDSKQIHHHNEWSLTQMAMEQMRTTIHTGAEVTTEVATRIVAEGIEIAIRANLEITTGNPTHLLLQPLGHQELRNRWLIMQLSMPSTTALVVIRMQPMVDTRTTSPIISIILNSRRSSRVKLFHHHHQVVRTLLRHLLLVLGVHLLHRQVPPAMAQYHLHQGCDGESFPEIITLLHSNEVPPFPSSELPECIASGWNNKIALKVEECNLRYYRWLLNASWNLLRLSQRLSLLGYPGPLAGQTSNLLSLPVPAPFFSEGLLSSMYAEHSPFSQRIKQYTNIMVKHPHTPPIHPCLFD